LFVCLNKNGRQKISAGARKQGKRILNLRFGLKHKNPFLFKKKRYAHTDKIFYQGKRTKILPLHHENNTGIYIRGRRISDREKVLTQVVRYFIDRSLYLFE
jgi:hypothetical protein